jgi:hypothetical protein
MTTFTTEDREHAFGATINVEPIPFVGWVNTAPPHIVDSGASVMGRNAYELAIERANNPYLDPEANAQDFKVLAEALRQQQAEISLLQEYVCQLERGLDSSINLNKAQAGRYDNNEPVAYIDCQDLERLPHHDCWVNGQEHKNNVPLYTHPAKTLTDEEIQAIAKESYVWNTGKQEWSEIEFARAILRKAQEK